LKEGDLLGLCLKGTIKGLQNGRGMFSFFVPFSAVDWSLIYGKISL
jgi:hypothetical protein